MTRRLRFLLPCIAGTLLASCSGGSTSTPITQPTGTNTVSIRVVHGSPDAGPVDVYIYTSGATQPGTPIVANVQYPGISQYFSYPVGSYVVAFDAAGTTTQLATEPLSGTTTGAQLTIALSGQVSKSTLQLQNFVEPGEVSGTSALIVHHASPAINTAVSPVGVAVYGTTSSAPPPPASATSELFAFALASGTGGANSSSGPAPAGNVAGGEYFVSPLPSTLPSPLGFAAGPPNGSGVPLTSVAASATLSGLAANVSSAGYGRTSLTTTLANDTSDIVPSGAHVSVFAVDSVVSPPGILIGTLDP